MREYQLGLYEKALPNDMTIADKLHAASRAGFDFLEISIDETDEKLARLDFTSAQKNELRRMIDDVGLPIKTICLSGHRKYPLGSQEPAVVRRSLEIMDKAIDLGSNLGVRLIQLAGYDVYYEVSTEASRERFDMNLRKAVDKAAAAGMLLGFETMETEFMDTVKKAMAYVEAVCSPYLQIYPDTGNLTNAMLKYGDDLARDTQTGRGHIVAAHLKETLPGRYRDVPYGSGHTPFPVWIRLLRQMGVNLFLGEFWWDSSADPDHYIRTACDFLRRQFELAAEADQ